MIANLVELTCKVEKLINYTHSPYIWAPFDRPFSWIGGNYCNVGRSLDSRKFFAEQDRTEQSEQRGPPKDIASWLDE